MALILIVEDERPIREFMAESLSEQGHKILQASNGRQALTLLSNADPAPALVIADIMMPLGNGNELCRAIKASPTLRNLPVILMSAAAESAVGNSGADAFLRKPFELSALDDLVESFLSR